MNKLLLSELVGKAIYGYSTGWQNVTDDLETHAVIQMTVIVQTEVYLAKYYNKEKSPCGLDGLIHTFACGVMTPCYPQSVDTLYSYIHLYGGADMARKKTQAYTEEFRREAVKRSEKQGVTQAQVAKELGISAQQIANWKRQFTRLSDKQFNSAEGVDYSKKESEEVRRLKRENKRLEEELAFLKKAAAYFASNQE